MQIKYEREREREREREKGRDLLIIHTDMRIANLREQRVYKKNFNRRRDNKKCMIL